jgi:hypothetical protein
MPIKPSFQVKVKLKDNEFEHMIQNECAHALTPDEMRNELKKVTMYTGIEKFIIKPDLSQIIN